MAIGRRGRPPATSVVPFVGNGLGLPVVTPLPTRQWQRPAARHFRQVPIDWRPEGPQLTFSANPDPAAPAADSPCEDCD